MDFRTILPQTKAPFGISHHDRLLLIGSCFTEHIGARLAARKFKTLLNPFGIVYNPVSIGACLERLLEGNRPFLETELFETQGLWHSWEHHGVFSGPDREQCLARINNAYQAASAALRQTDCLLLTLGTAEVFYLMETGTVVANNHKMPATLFGQRRLSVSDITSALLPVLQKIKARQPELRIILTVSPVRHLRNGAVENQRSKAALLLACAELCAALPDAVYFPAYELLLDDLRDYRFYASDMLHPSETAVEYIWQYFSKMFFSDNTQQLIAQIEKILAAARHRPFNPDTPAHRAFMHAQVEAIRRLQEQADLDFDGELEIFCG